MNDTASSVFVFRRYRCRFPVNMLLQGEAKSLLRQVDLQAKFVQLALVDEARSVEHDIASTVVLGESDAIADAIELCKEADEAVQSVGKTSVRGCTVLEGIHQEAELLLGLLRGEAEDFEYLLLQFGIVDTDAAATYLNTVDDHPGEECPRAWAR